MNEATLHSATTEFLPIIHHSYELLVDHHLPITPMAPLLRRILTPILTQLGMANLARIRAVEENIPQVFILVPRALEGSRQVILRETCPASISHYIQDGSGRLTLRIKEYIRAVIETRGAGFIGEPGHGQCQEGGEDGGGGFHGAPGSEGKGGVEVE